MNAARRHAIWPSLPQTSGWTPVKLEDGPAPPGAMWVGFGITLKDGDVWIDKPQVGVVPDAALSRIARAKRGKCLRGLARIRARRALERPDVWV